MATIKLTELTFFFKLANKPRWMEANISFPHKLCEYKNYYIFQTSFLNTYKMLFIIYYLISRLLTIYIHMFNLILGVIFSDLSKPLIGCRQCYILL